jgi:hypothetical protein
MMARAPKDEFGTPFGQAGSAAATKLGTPFGQAKSAQDENIAESDARLRARIPSSPSYVAPEVPVVTETPKDGNNTPDPNEGFTTSGNQALYKGVPFNGMRNGIQFINGYRQDLYDENGKERTNKPKNTEDAEKDLLLEQQKAAQEAADKRDRQSAYDILYNEFNKYGLGSLVEDVKYLIQSNVSPSQFALELQNTKSYQQRFSANQDRIKAGLSALSPAEYIGLEDQYQSIMRNYGLPATYYTKDSTGKQSGFDKFLVGDVSASELEDRIATAQQRVVNSNPEVLQALKQFYPDISNADILAYTLDPQNALTSIKRKVTAAEIGGAALAQGLQAQGGTAESLAGQGITKAQAQQGYTEVAGILPRGSQLADIYGEDPYTQQTAEAEVFNTSGAASARKKREKLISLEQASFGGSSGASQGALSRDRAGNI